MVLSPHTDDAELGCGGTIARLIREGSEVKIVVFSRCEDSLPPELPKNALEFECLAALSCLSVPSDNIDILTYKVRRFCDSRQSILDLLVAINRSFKPHTVFCPSPGDIHQDHRTVSEEAQRAFKHCTLLGYELPWNDSRFCCDLFVSLNLEDVSSKKSALMQYESQIQVNRDYFRPEFVEEWSRFRGLQSGTKFAEAFEVYRIRV